MKRSLAADDPLRPLVPADLQSSSVPSGAALECAEPGYRGTAESVTGVLRRHGWTSSAAADPDLSGRYTTLRGATRQTAPGLRGHGRMVTGDRRTA
jgi:hypothetical protein